MAEPKYTYVSEAKPADCITTSGRFASGFQGVIRRSDGIAVWTSKIYLGDRAKSTALLQANRWVRNYRDHLARHGDCFYDQEKAKKDAIKAWSEEAKRQRQRLESAVFNAFALITYKNPANVTPFVAEPGSIEAQVHALALEVARKLPPKPPGY